jgi:hypothetical protein
MRGSTQLGDYREFGSHCLMARDEGTWHAPAGDYSCLRFDLDAIELQRRSAAQLGCAIDHTLDPC